MVLRSNGHEAEITRNGEDGLRAALEGQPDVLLLDLALPKMSGYDLARSICELRPHKTPLIIAVTGYGSEEDRRRTDGAGLDLHLLKPIDPVLLEGILRRFQKFVVARSSFTAATSRRANGR